MTALPTELQDTFDQIEGRGGPLAYYDIAAEIEEVVSPIEQSDQDLSPTFAVIGDLGGFAEKFRV